jgi:hypothetical protein
MGEGGGGGAVMAPRRGRKCGYATQYKKKLVCEAGECVKIPFRRNQPTDTIGDEERFFEPLLRHTSEGEGR